MTPVTAGCALLGDSHETLREGVRGLLKSVFATQFMVADEASLASGAGLLQPALIVADMALAPRDVVGFVSRLRDAAPGARVLLLSAHEDSAVARRAIAAGADGVVLTRSLATDLLAGVDAVLSGIPYVSPAMRTPQARPGASAAQ